ncbi:MAG TPA: hypothetical protein VI978_01280 [Candidatus Paceibacterota bacterium]
MTEEQNKFTAGPVFESGPGWGKKINSWIKKNFWKKIFPALAITILLIGIASVYSRPPKTAKIEDKLSATDSLEIMVEKGDGIIALARKALNNYLEGLPEVKLKPEQKLYIDNFFKSKMSGQILQVGQKIDFLKNDLEQAVKEALALPENKLEKLRQYLK